MSDDREESAGEGRGDASFTLRIQLPLATLDALREELNGLLEHAEADGHARAFLSSVVRSLRAAQVFSHPERVPLRDRLRFGADYARSYTGTLEAQDHPAASTLRRIADTLEEILRGTDEEIEGRMAEVENLIRRLNEFTEG